MDSLSSSLSSTATTTTTIPTPQIDPAHSALYHSVEWQGQRAILEGNLRAKEDLITKLTNDNKLIQNRLQSTRLELNTTNSAISQTQHELERLRGDNNNLLELVTKLETANNALQLDYIAKLEYEHGINTKIRQLSYKLNVDNAENNNTNNLIQDGKPLVFDQHGNLINNVGGNNHNHCQLRIKQLEEKLQQRHANYEELLTRFETQHLASKNITLDLREKISKELSLNLTLKQQYALLQKSHKETTNLISTQQNSLQSLQAAYDGLMLEFNTATMKLQHTEEREKHAVQRCNVLESQSSHLLKSETTLRTQLQQLKTTSMSYEYEYNKLCKVYAALKGQYEDKNAKLFNLVVQNNLKVDQDEFRVAIEQCTQQTSTRFITRAQLESLLTDNGNSTSIDDGDINNDDNNNNNSNNNDNNNTITSPFLQTTRPTSTLPPHTKHQLETTQDHIMGQLQSFLVAHYQAMYQLKESSQPLQQNDNSNLATSSPSPPSQPLILLENGIILTPAGLSISVPMLYRQHTELLGEYKGLLVKNDKNSKSLLELQGKMTNILSEMQSKLDHSKEMERRKHQEEIDRLNEVIKSKDDELAVMKKNKNQLSTQLQVLIRSKLGASNFTPGSAQSPAPAALNNFNTSFNTSFSNNNHHNTSQAFNASTFNIDNSTLSWNSVDELQVKYEGLLNELFRLHAQNTTVLAQNEANLGKLEHFQAQIDHNQVQIHELTQKNGQLIHELEQVKSSNNDLKVNGNNKQSFPQHRRKSTQISFGGFHTSMGDGGFGDDFINSSFAQLNNNSPNHQQQQPNPWQLELTTAQLTVQSQQTQIAQLTTTLSQNDAMIINLTHQNDKLSRDKQLIETKLNTSDDIRLALTEKCQNLFFDLTTIKSTLNSLQLQYDQQKSQCDLAMANLDKAQNDKITIQADLLTAKNDYNALKNDLILIQSQYDDLNGIYKLTKGELDSVKAQGIDYNNNLIKMGESYQAQIHQLLEKVNNLTNQREELIIKLQSGFSTPMEYSHPSSSILFGHHNNNHHQQQQQLPARPSSVASSSTANDDDNCHDSDDYDNGSTDDDNDAKQPQPQQQRHELFTPFKSTTTTTKSKKALSTIKKANPNQLNQNQLNQFNQIGDNLALREKARSTQAKYDNLERDYKLLQNQLKSLQESVNADKLTLRGQILEQQQLIATLQGEKNSLGLCVEELQRKVRAIISTRLLQAGVLVKPPTSSASKIPTTTDITTPPVTMSEDTPGDAQLSISVSQLEEMIAATTRAKELSTQVLSLQTELDSITETLRNTTQSYTSLQTANNTLQSLHDSLIVEAEGYRVKISELEDKLTATQTSLDEKTTFLTETKQNLLLLQAQYNTISDERNKLLIEVKSTFETLTLSRSDLEMEKIARQQQVGEFETTIQSHNNTIKSLEDEKSSLQIQSQNQLQQLEQLQTQFESASTQLTQRDTLIKKLQQEIVLFQSENTQNLLKIDDLITDYSKLETLHQSTNAELIQLRDGLGGVEMDSFNNYNNNNNNNNGMNNNNHNNATTNSGNETQLITALRLDKDDLIQKLETFKLQFEQLQGTNKHSSQELEAIRTQLSTVTNSYNSLQDDYDTIKAKFSTLHQEYTTAINNYNTLERQYNELMEEHNELETSHKDLSVTNDTTSSSSKATSTPHKTLLTDQNGDCLGCHELNIKLSTQQSITSQRTEQLAVLHKQYKVLFDSKYILERELSGENGSGVSESDGTGMGDAMGTPKQRQYVLELLKMESKLKNLLIREDIETQELTQIYQELTTTREQMSTISSELNQNRTRLELVMGDYHDLELEITRLGELNQQLIVSRDDQSSHNDVIMAQSTKQLTQTQSELDTIKKQFDDQTKQHEVLKVALKTVAKNNEKLTQQLKIAQEQQQQQHQQHPPQQQGSITQPQPDPSLTHPATKRKTMVPSTNDDVDTTTITESTSPNDSNEETPIKKSRSNDIIPPTPLQFISNDSQDESTTHSNVINNTDASVDTTTTTTMNDEDFVSLDNNTIIHSKPFEDIVIEPPIEEIAVVDTPIEETASIEEVTLVDVPIDVQEEEEATPIETQMEEAALVEVEDVSTTTTSESSGEPTPTSTEYDPSDDSTTESFNDNDTTMGDALQPIIEMEESQQEPIQQEDLNEVREDFDQDALPDIREESAPETNEQIDIEPGAVLDENQQVEESEQMIDNEPVDMIIEDDEAIVTSPSDLNRTTDQIESNMSFDDSTIDTGMIDGDDNNTVESQPLEEGEELTTDVTLITPQEQLIDCDTVIDSNSNPFEDESVVVHNINDDMLTAVDEDIEQPTDIVDDAVADEEPLETEVAQQNDTAVFEQLFEPDQELL